MTQDEIIEMAKEADLVTWLNTSQNFSSGVWWIEAHEPDDCLFKFAKLVAQHERERIKAANAPEIERINAHIKELEDAVLAEREACAKEAERTFYSVQAAENIRARSNV